MTKSNPGIQALGSWARYLGLGTQAEADDEQSWNTELINMRRAHLSTGVAGEPPVDNERFLELQATGSWARYLGLGTLA